MCYGGHSWLRQTWPRRLSTSILSVCKPSCSWCWKWLRSPTPQPAPAQIRFFLSLEVTMSSDHMEKFKKFPCPWGKKWPSTFLIAWYFGVRQFGSLGGLPVWRAFFKAQHTLLLGLTYLKAFQQNSMLNCWHKTYIFMLEKIGQEKMCIPCELRGYKINERLFGEGYKI